MKLPLPPNLGLHVVALILAIVLYYALKSEPNRLHTNDDPHFLEHH